MKKQLSMKSLKRFLQVVLVIDMIMIFCIVMSMVFSNGLNDATVKKIVSVKSDLMTTMVSEISKLNDNAIEMQAKIKETYIDVVRNTRAINELKKEIATLKEQNKILLAKVEVIECLKIK